MTFVEYKVIDESEDPFDSVYVQPSHGCGVRLTQGDKEISVGTEQARELGKLLAQMTVLKD